MSQGDVIIPAWITRGLWVVVTSVFFFGSWCATLEWRTHSMLEQIASQTKDITFNAGKLVQIEVWKAATEANHFTAQDHLSYAARADRDLADTKSRVAIVENGMLNVGKQLDRIERKLDASK